jgi:hypothetical protein
MTVPFRSKSFPPCMVCPLRSKAEMSEACIKGRVHSPDRYPANVAHMTQSRADYGRSFQVKGGITSNVVKS